MKKVGILGGTFNPIHNGHLHIASMAQKQFQLDEIWFMPAGSPPHKEVADHVSGAQRLEMVRIAIERYPSFVAVDWEVKKKAPCYSWKTLEELHDMYGGTCTFYFIIGEDSLYSFEHWVKPEIICKYAVILAARRPSDFEVPEEWEHGKKQKKDVPSLQSEKNFSEMLAYYHEKFGQDFFEIRLEPENISSSDIRRHVYEKEQVKEMLPDAIQQYICRHQLYLQTFSMEELKEIQKKMKEELKTGRYEHTIGVMYTAGSLAFSQGYPYSTAMMAGLLHDCAKCMTDEKRLSICKKQDIPVSEAEAAHPHLLHGKVGAFLAKERYHIKDEQICHAIAVHTTGVPKMSLLDKIIFVADYIEPHRDKAPRLDEVRKMAYCNLDRCVLMILEDTIHYLRQDSLEEMDATTLETYEYYRDHTEISYREHKEIQQK